MNNNSTEVAHSDPNKSITGPE